MGAQRRQRGKPQHTGPHLRFSGRAGRRSARLSLLPFCQTASAFRLICLFHTFCRRGVHRAMVSAPLRCPNLFRFPFACLWVGPSACFAHLYIKRHSFFNFATTNQKVCNSSFDAIFKKDVTTTEYRFVSYIGSCCSFKFLPSYIYEALSHQ